MSNCKRIIAQGIGAVAATLLIAITIVTLIRHTAEAVRLAPWPARSFTVSPAEPGHVADDQDLRRAAPREPDNPDAGVAEAAREFSIPFVTRNLTSPASAKFPEDGIRFERLALLSQTTGGKMEYWLVEGSVDSQNRFGVTVRSHWRTILGRTDDYFFPAMVLLDGRGIYQLRDHVALLEESRQAAVQERLALAAARKTEEVAANRAAWKALADAKPDEEKAAAALKLAVSLLDAGRKEPARRRLHELIDKFPESHAALEAAELLKQ